MSQSAISDRIIGRACWPLKMDFEVNCFSSLRFNTFLSCSGSGSNKVVSGENEEKLGQGHRTAGVSVILFSIFYAQTAKK